ncbi:hypothetical protein Q6257_28665, partial [Klebsiella variicola]|nr:hypothetical protein [Klebsiella variicola]
NKTQVGEHNTRELENVIHFALLVSSGDEILSELTAVGKYVHYWWPEIPTWVSAAAFFVLINLINLANIKVFGEAEFWFAIIKVVAIVG